MLHPPQTIGTTQVTTIAEGVTGDEAVNWHYADIMDLDENILVPILAETANDDALYRIGGTTILGDDITGKNSPELYDYWDFYYDWAASYTGPDIDMETYVCDTLGVCRGTPGDPQDPPHVAFNYYKGNYPGGEWLTRLENIGARSLAEMDSRWDLGYGEWAFAYGSWTDTLDTLYFDQIVDKVQLNSIVTDVDTSGGVAVVTWIGQHGQQAGSATANAVLSTVPVGNLKAGDVTFTPPLSARKLAALDLLGVGNGGKLFMQFSSRFWPNNVNVFYADGLYAHYCWDYEYRGGDGGAVLTCYVTGEYAEDLETVGGESQQIAAVLSDLDAMYPGTLFSDSYVSGSGFWKFLDTFQFSRGGFTYPKIGAYPTDGSPSARQILAEPESTKLYFAGAPTHDSWASTVVGALDSGLRAAGEIDADHEPVPEPRGSVMLIAGAAFLGLLYRRRMS
jgi:hypothetical protein